ncbi:MAG: hypothetical protein KDD12_04965 [Lewinella sp.]|nr:hypothetical protein [Lewinella sp.]
MDQIKMIFLFILFFINCNHNMSLIEDFKIEINGPISKIPDYKINGEIVDAYWYLVRLKNSGDSTVYISLHNDSIYPPIEYKGIKVIDNERTPFYGRWEIANNGKSSIEGFSQKDFKFYLTEIPDLDTISYIFLFSHDSTLQYRKRIKVNCIKGYKWELKSVGSQILDD